MYAAFEQGERTSLPELPVQYGDYAIWQRARLRSDAIDRQLGYWKRQLADAPVLELPVDQRRPSVQTFRGHRCAVVVPRAIHVELQELSRRESVTMFMTLLAAFQLLLYRYTAIEDVSVGTPIAGRHRPELEGVVGLFLNTLVLRTNVRGDLTLRELLHQVRRSTLDAYANQDVPFERVIDAVQPQRDLSRNPLFQVMLIHQPRPNESLVIPGLTVDTIDTVNETSKLDLTAFIVDAGELSIALEYNTDLFKPETAERLLRIGRACWRRWRGTPAQRVDTLDLLSAAERAQVVEHWNDTPGIDVPAACLHALVQAQVERTPDAIAVIDDAGMLTYEALAAQAAAIASALRQRGVGPGVCVAVCMARATSAVAALLGVLESGAAYVPVEPSWPFERIATVLTTVHARAVIGDGDRLDTLAPLETAVPTLATLIGVTTAAAPHVRPGARRARDARRRAIRTISPT